MIKKNIYKYHSLHVYKCLYDIIILNYISTINTLTNYSELLMIISNDHSVNFKN